MAQNTIIGPLHFQLAKRLRSFSVSQSNVDSVKAYIANRAEHHRKISLQEELPTFLTTHKVDFDERYL